MSLASAVAHLKVETLPAHFKGWFLYIFEVFQCEAGFSSWCVRTPNNYLIFSISDWIDQFWHFMKKAGNIQYLGTIFRVWQHCPIRSKNNKQIFDENLRIIWEKLSAWVTWLKNINKKSNFFMELYYKMEGCFL